MLKNKVKIFKVRHCDIPKYSNPSKYMIVDDYDALFNSGLELYFDIDKIIKDRVNFIKFSKFYFNKGIDKYVFDVKEAFFFNNDGTIKNSIVNYSIRYHNIGFKLTDTKFILMCEIDSLIKAINEWNNFTFHQSKVRFVNNKKKILSLKIN